jgi:hypothetical protein
MFYSFQKRLLTPVLQLQILSRGWKTSQLRVTGGQFFAEVNWHSSITMAENFQ